MDKRLFDLIVSICADIRKYPEDMDAYLKLIVSICELNKLD